MPATATSSPVVQAADKNHTAMLAATYALLRSLRANLIAKASSFENVYERTILAGAVGESRFTANLSIINPRAVEAAQQRAAELVQYLDDEARETMRQVFGETLMGRMTTAQSNRVIRDLIGLDSRSAVAVMNYRSGLNASMNGTAPFPTPDLADGRFTGNNLTPGKIDSLTDRYTSRLLTRRADNIARTEVMTAAHRGQMENWRAAAEQGLFDPEKAQRVWVSTEDSRECPVCAELDGQTFLFDSSEMPPEHPSCRCTLSLVVE